MGKLLLLLACLFIGIRKNYAQDNLKLAKDKDGIKVFTGPVSASDYYAFKAVMSLKSTEIEILKILKDVGNYPEWFAFTSSVKLIYQNGNDHQFILETDYPWPYSNECKNYTMKFTKRQDGKQEITISGSEIKTGCKYSLKKANGYILLEADGVNTKITYYFHSEPSQNIPSWLINPRIHEMPFQTFISLRKRIYSSK